MRLTAPLPRLKGWERRIEDGEIVLEREPGTEFRLDDDGRVGVLLDLLDGTRRPDEVARELCARFPDVEAAEVAAGIAALDEAGLLEDAGADTALDARAQERYFSNLAFFSTWETLARSRYAYQEALRRAHVLLLGVGGLGSTVLYNLAGLGVGSVVAVDCDRVELRNFARQFLYSAADIGRPKVERAIARIRAFDPELDAVGVERRIEGPEDVADLLPADLVVSVVDRPATVHEWVNDACVRASVPFVSGGMRSDHGVFLSVLPGETGCLGCLRLDPVGAEAAPELDARTVNRGIGPVASLMGSHVALETLRILSGFAPPVAAGRIVRVRFETGELEQAYGWRRSPSCPVCASSPVGAPAS